MKKSLKRGICALLCMTLIFALGAVPASAEQIDSVNGIDGELYLNIMCTLIVLLIVVFLLSIVFLGIVIMKTKKK